jgi:hypothetical protein
VLSWLEDVILACHACVTCESTRDHTPITLKDASLETIIFDKEVCEEVVFKE